MMNPFELDATGLLIWGWVAHLVADWILQDDWMSNHKMLRRSRHNPTTMTGERGTSYLGPWWDRHPAAYVHAGIHGILLAPVFGWPAAVIAIVHLVIDTRAPVAWLSKLVGQTQPSGKKAMTAGPITVTRRDLIEMDSTAFFEFEAKATAPLYDIGTEVRIWADQVWHVVALAIAALLVA